MGAVTSKSSTLKQMGISPRGNLIEASNGYLYGTTNDHHNRYGGIFRVLPDGTDFMQLHKFNFTDGAWPWGGYLQASDGPLDELPQMAVRIQSRTIFKIDLDATNFELCIVLME